MVMRTEEEEEEEEFELRQGADILFLFLHAGLMQGMPVVRAGPRPFYSNNSAWRKQSTVWSLTMPAACM